MRMFLALILLTTPAQAQVEAKIAAMVDRFFQVCPLALDDPNAYAATLQVPGPEGQQVAANTPDGQHLWVVDYADGVRQDVTIAVAGTEQIRHCNMIHSDLFLGSSTDIAAALEAALATYNGVTLTGGVIPHDLPIPGAEGVFDGGFQRFETTHRYMFTGPADTPGFSALALIDDAIELYSFRTLSTVPTPATPEEETLGTGYSAYELSMRRIAEICITMYDQPQAVIETIREEGYTLDELEADTYALGGGPGISGTIEFGEDQGFCSVQSPDVPLDATQTIGVDLAARHYPDAWQPGHPERGMSSPCDGISLFAPQRQIWISYADAGNGGTCDGTGGSAILVNM